MTLGLTLREFCREHGLDPANMSRIERDLLPPPSDRSRLEQYAQFLGLDSKSDDWYAFFDLAAAARGRIPDYVMSDEDLVAKLPLVFRTMRERRLSKRQLEDLAKKIKGG
jgi:transcriptional regulator with XRE-family HTH domain